MKYLIDTSIWINHLRNRNEILVQLLEDNQVYIHPFIIGEIACGNLKNRKEVINLLKQLPEAVITTHKEAINYLDQHKLSGKGIGWIDIHLLSSCALTSIKLFTVDKRLQKIADNIL